MNAPAAPYTVDNVATWIRANTLRRMTLHESRILAEKWIATRRRVYQRRAAAAATYALLMETPIPDPPDVHEDDEQPDATEFTDDDPFNKDRRQLYRLARHFSDKRQRTEVEEEILAELSARLGWGPPCPPPPAATVVSGGLPGLGKR